MTTCKNCFRSAWRKLPNNKGYNDASRLCSHFKWRLLSILMFIMSLSAIFQYATELLVKSAVSTWFCLLSLPPGSKASLVDKVHLQAYMVYTVRAEPGFCTIIKATTCRGIVTPQGWDACPLGYHWQSVITAVIIPILIHHFAITRKLYSSELSEFNWQNVS